MFRYLTQALAQIWSASRPCPCQGTASWVHPDAAGLAGCTPPGSPLPSANSNLLQVSRLDEITKDEGLLGGELLYGCGKASPEDQTDLHTCLPWFCLEGCPWHMCIHLTTLQIASTLDKELVSLAVPVVDVSNNSVPLLRRV